MVGNLAGMVANGGPERPDRFGDQLSGMAGEAAIDPICQTGMAFSQHPHVALHIFELDEMFRSNRLDLVLE